MNKNIMIKYIIFLIIIFYLIFYIFNSKYNNILIENNSNFNIFTNYYDLKELIHLYTYNNELKNIKVKIPRYIKPRKDTPINNKYELIKNNIIYDDFFFVIYYLTDYKCKIIVRRLDSYQLNYNFSIKIYDLKNDNFETINFIDYKKNNNNEIIIEYKTKIQLYKVIYNETKIPKVIIQTGNNYEISLAQYNSALTFIELNPEYSYIYFDDNDRRNFIIKYFDNSVITAYDNVIPGAFKADIFRYCYIYINGGCYFDNKIINRIPIRDIINNDEIILIDDRTIFYNNIYNGILLSIKNHIIFKNCINNCVNNIKNKFYGKTPWDISGPTLMKKYGKNYKRKLLLYADSVNFKIIHKRKIIIKESNKIFCNICYYEYYDKFFSSTYYILWLKKKIYK